MSITQVIQLGAGKVLATSPQEGRLDLRLRDRGRWGAASLTRNQATQLRDQIEAWLQESLPPDAYESDLAAFGHVAPLPVWYAQPELCVLITPDESLTSVMVRTTRERAAGISLRDYIAVVVNGENRMAQVDWIAEVSGGPSENLPGSPDGLVDIRAWFPLGSVQNLQREAQL